MYSFFPVIEVMIPPTAPLTEAIACIDRSNGEIALIVDDAKRLLGTITDGDIRRALLRGVKLADPAAAVMNTSPRTAPVTASPKLTRMQMELAQIRQLPLVDESGLVVDLVLLDAVKRDRYMDNLVVLMAGGLGQRLRPLTEQMPKPLLPLGGKPILQNIVERFVEQGFRRFLISTNYLGEKIEEYFGNGERFGAEISYLRETKRLGTAGCLSLIPLGFKEPIIVMNGDLVTSVNFNAMLQFHEAEAADATMGVNLFHFDVPFGVVEIRDDRILGLREKPRIDCLVNSGIYILNPDNIRHIPKDQPFDMPSLFDAVIAAKGRACAFPIHERWLDIGRPEELDRAREEFNGVVANTPSTLLRANNAIS